jgi:hypothetical protein
MVKHSCHKCGGLKSGNLSKFYSYYCKCPENKTLFIQTYWAPGEIPPWKISEKTK